MTKELPFEHLVDTIKEYRSKLEVILKDEYKNIDYKNSLGQNIDKSSKQVQQNIFNRFVKDINLSEFKVFRDNFNAVIASRDKSLERYVSNSVDYLKSLEGNDKLIKAHFLQVNARDKKTDNVESKIIPITGYYNEETIHFMLKNDTKKHIPSFNKPEITPDTLKDIELLSVSNITGLYNPRDIISSRNIINTNNNNYNNIFDGLKYKIYSRVKTSDRERDKFVDWVLGLRDQDDYPYDSIGMIVVMPNTNTNCLECGKELYKFRDYVFDTSKRHKNDIPIQKNVKNRVENNNSSVKKLLDEGYDRDNYFQVIRQLRVTNKDLDERFRNKIPILDKDEESKLLQGIQLKHHYENDRAETWIMNQEMYENYTGRYIGHTSYYIKARELQRKTFLENPALSYAKSKNPKNPEPSLYDLANYFEMLFRNVFRFTNANS